MPRVNSPWKRENVPVILVELLDDLREPPQCALGDMGAHDSGEAVIPDLLSDVEKSVFELDLGRLVNEETGFQAGDGGQHNSPSATRTTERMEFIHVRLNGSCEQSGKSLSSHVFSRGFSLLFPRNKGRRLSPPCRRPTISRGVNSPSSREGLATATPASPVLSAMEM